MYAASFFLYCLWSKSIKFNWNDDLTLLSGMCLVILTLPVFLLSLQQRGRSPQSTCAMSPCAGVKPNPSKSIFSIIFLFCPLHTPALFPSGAVWGHTHRRRAVGCTVEALFAQIKVCYEWTFAPSEHDDVQFDRITHQLVRVTLRVFYVCLLVI